MSSVKEIRELLRAGSVLAAKIAVARADGEISRREKIGILLTSFSSWVEAIVGVGHISDELRDIDMLESEELISEIMSILRNSKHFTYRERDIAERILRFTYSAIVAFDEITDLPPTAIAV